MGHTEHNTRLRHIVEEMGLHFEAGGGSRMTGRILGWLLVCDPDVQSSRDLVDALAASKGSISTHTRVLLQMGLIEKVPSPGKRGLFFRITPDAWTRMLHLELAYSTMFRELAERGLELLADAPASRRQRLEEMRDLYLFVEREFPTLIERWKATKETP